MSEFNYFDDQLKTNQREEYLSQWKSEMDFEEDVRDILKLLRPHRGERLKGWNEHRTRGDGFRVTVSWDPSHEETHEPFCIPKIADVIESLLVGSAREQDLLDPHAEFELYASVVRELDARLRELRSRYE
jgi:hypothetical protein